MSPPPKEEDESAEEDEEDDEQGATCGACGDNYGTDEFWICCDVCERWFHGKCVKITPAKAEHIKQYKCPSCSGKRARVQKLKTLGSIIAKRNGQGFTMFDNDFNVNKVGCLLQSMDLDDYADGT